MVFDMERDSISPEENNLLRMIYIIKKPCTESLRRVLKNDINSSHTDVRNAVSSARFKLRGILSQKQYSKIFPQNQICPDFDVHKCDISLLYTLIRNVSSIKAPSTGWGMPVNNQPRENSIGANVERLRQLRNDILHEDRHEITNSDFNNFSIDIEASLADIDQLLGTNFKQDVIYLRTVSLEKEFVQKEITKIRARKHFHEIKEQLGEVSNATNNIQHELCRNTEKLGELINTMTNNQQQRCRNTEVQNEQKVMLEKIYDRVCRNTVQCEVRHDPQDMARCECIQRLSLEALENTDRTNHQCMNDRESAEVNCDDSVNIQNLHNEADNKGAPTDAMNFDMSRDNDISIADGLICLTKQYVYIKSNLLKKEAVKIAECLLEKEHITKDEHETIAGLERKSSIDTLLKKIILGEDTDQLKAFFRALRSVNKKVFSDTEATKVTDEDRSRFKQVEERALQVTNARSRSVAETILDDSDILFFQNRLSSSQEVVDFINDTMLARFNFSVREHSNILECKDSDPKIRRLCETMNLCDMDVEKELKTLLRASLYEKWIVFRKQKENQDRPKYLRWLNALVSPVHFMFPTLRFNKAVNGCIILKFSTGDSFDFASLTREFVQENVTDLLWKGNLETQMNIKNPVHVTVFIMSPSKNGNDEIHFYLDFDAADERTRGEDCGHEIANQERLLEQLDLIEVTEWIMNQPDMEKTTTKMLEDKLSCSDMSRKEELHSLLDSIYDIKNGQELIERFCKENYPDVYKNLFLRNEQDSSEKNTSLVQKPLQYERGEGLQRLYSFTIDINTDQKGIKMLQETEGLQRATLDERPSKDLPNPEVSVWKRRGITYVIQVGKLEDVWSDAVVIMGQDRYCLPRTIIEKVGPHIQREFQDKYPNGLCYNEVAVLSGCNLPIWKIFYCRKPLYGMRACLEMADNLKMKSILFLVQEEHLEDIDFISTYNGLWISSISVIYFHVDQDTLGWRWLREIAEGRLFTRTGFFGEYLSDVIKPSAGPEPKGDTTVIIQFGKLEEIQSEAVVIFEAATGQWPSQNLPSEILEKAGPMIQREFTEKFPAGLEYAEVAVLNGYNLPFRKILYGVLPRWPGAWLKQVIAVFLTECFQLANDEGIKSIAYLIPSVTYHIAELYASVLHGMRIYDEPSLKISKENIVIKDGCTGANMLKKVFEDEWASKRVFKEGHMTVVTGKSLLQEILMRRGKATQTSAKLSEGSLKKAILPDSKALVIVSKLKDFTNVLEEIGPSLKAEFRTKYPSALPNDKVTILDGYNDPFKKIYWRNFRLKAEITDIILECFQMAKNDQMNSIILQIHPHRAIKAIDIGQEIILGLQIFAIENPISGIRRLYNDTGFFRQEISDITSVKVFKERHVTVVLNATYDEGEYMNSVHVICDVTDEEKLGKYLHRYQYVWQPQRLLHEYLRHMKQSQSQQTQKKGMMHFQKGFTSGEVFVFEHDLCNTIRVFLGTPKLNRQDMNMFFYKCIQEADGCGVSSVTFLVPEIVRRFKLFASTLISCVKRFTKETPSSSIKRIYIRINRFNAEFKNTKQIFEKIWANTSGEENPDYLTQQIDEHEVFKEGHMTVVSGDGLLEDIFMRRGKATQTSEKLSEGLQEKAIVPDSKALVIVSNLEDFTNVLEEIGLSLKAGFRTKYPSAQPNDKVAILDGYNNPFKKIYWMNYTLEVEITDIILECFQMAENDQMNSIILQIRPHRAIEAMDLRQELILGLRIFALENPFSGIRKIYNDTWFFREEIHHLLGINDQGPEHKMNSVHVICDVTDVEQTRVYFHEYLRDMKQKQSLRTQKKGMMHFQKGFTSGEDFVFEHDLCNTIRVFLGTPKLNRQDMKMFFYKCIQEADGCGVPSVTFLVPEIVRRFKFFASTLISCAKRFAKETPSSSIKRIYIRINRFNAELQNTKQIFEEIWAKTSGEENPDYLTQQIDEHEVFKEGHMTVVSGDGLLEDIFMRRGKATQTSAKLSEGLQEKAIVPDSKALVIVSNLEDFTNVLEEIGLSLKAEFRTKYPSAQPNDKVAILDGYNNPFKKIYWMNYTLEVEITDIILECFQMAENDKMNSIILQIRPHRAIEATDLGQELILGLRIFAIENPFSVIRKIYNDTWFFREEVFDVPSVKVFKKRHVTVALNATYNEREYSHVLRDHGLHVPYHQGPDHKMNSVHVICDVTDGGQPAVHFHEYRGHMKQRQSLQTQEKGMMHFHKGVTSREVLVLEHYFCNTIRIIIGTPKLDRQDMNMFFYKSIQEADGCGVSSVTFLVPNIVQSIKLFACTLISCVKRFAKDSPSSSIKRIYIRIDRFHAEFFNYKQVFEKEWARTSGEENPDYLSQQIDEPQEEHGGKQDYPSEDIYLKKKLSIMELPEKSKEGSKYVSHEDVDQLPQRPHESSK